MEHEGGWGLGKGSGKDGEWRPTQSVSTRNTAMPKLKLPLLILAYMALLAFACLCFFVPWIPEWSAMADVGGVLGTLGSFCIGAWIVVTVWVQGRERLPDSVRILLSLGLGFFVGIVTFVASMMALFTIQGGLFDPVFIARYEFPDHGRTLYLYDASFLDPAYEVRVRKGFWPWSGQVLRGGGDPVNLVVLQEGEWAVSDLFRIHLPTCTAEPLY